MGWRIEEERKSEWFTVMVDIKAENTYFYCNLIYNKVS
jgi:protein associated with RNAse G/E